jgi:serine/threonine protein kinase
MALAPGAKLGPYEIVHPVGAGGMGEVYRARDARLNRTVAIKVLPSNVTSDPVALQRPLEIRGGRDQAASDPNRSSEDQENFLQDLLIA